MEHPIRDSDAYFHSTEYVAIYLHNFFDAFAKSLLALLTGVILYRLGVPLSLIMLFFALKFLLMGALSPLSLTLTSRIGVNATILLSSISYLIGAALLVLGSYENPIMLFSSLIFFSVKGALYHPLIHGVLSMYVDNTHRGRVNSLNLIFRTLAISLSVVLGSTLLVRGADIALLFAIAAGLGVSLLSYMLLLGKRKLTRRYGFVEVYRFLFSRRFRENVLPFSMQTFLILERILIPLFIYIVFDDLAITAAIIGAAVFVEFLVLYLFGGRIDRFSKESFFQSTVIKSINPLIFLASHIAVPFIYLGEVYHRISENVFEASFAAKIQTKARLLDDPILFTVSKEMSLCFAEFAILCTLALVALTVGPGVFLVIFLGSFVASWTIYATWRD